MIGDREQIARLLLRQQVGDGDMGVSISWGGNPQIPAHAALKAIAAALDRPASSQGGDAAIHLAELWYHADGFTDMAEAGTLPLPKPWISRALTEEHSGDCTKQPWSCMRCHAEEILPVARWVSDRLSITPASGGE